MIFAIYLADSLDVDLIRAVSDKIRCHETRVFSDSEPS